MKQDRRGWALAAGVAAAATAAGIGWAFWRQRGTDAGVERALWSSTFDTPDGTRLAMASLRGHPVVLNFWATWCPPCVREMPALDRFAREHAARGWRVVARAPISYAIGLAGFAGIELSRRLGNLAGGLPFTAVFGRDGRLLQRHMGETSYDQLIDWARSTGSA